jgi:phosphatidylinositol-bisphosphatase
LQVQVARVPTGLLGFIGNKGGVAVSFELHQKSFLFVSAHFAAHQEHVAKRNADAAQIEAKLSQIFQAAAADELVDDDDNCAGDAVSSEVKLAWKHRGERQVCAIVL